MATQAGYTSLGVMSWSADDPRLDSCVQHDVKELWLPSLISCPVFAHFLKLALAGEKRVQPSSAAARLLAGDCGSVVCPPFSCQHLVIWRASQPARRWLLGTDAVRFCDSLTSRRRQGTIVEISNMNRGLNPLPGGNFQTDRYGSAGYGVC